MKTKEQPTPNNTEQQPIDPIMDPSLSPDYYWRAYNVCKMGQEIPPEIVEIMADSANQAVLDWLKSINAPKAVIELYSDAEMLTIYERQLANGKALTPQDGADLLSCVVSAGKNMRIVGAKFCTDVIPNNMPGTLPRYTLQAVDPSTVSA